MNGYGQWIWRPGACLGNWEGEVLPAPLFRREFNLTEAVKHARLKICGLGYYELRLNGDKVGDHVLDPIVTHYDQRARYVSYDVTRELTAGENAIGVMLGNGWYNCFTSEVWHFDKASWRDYPKLWLDLEIELKSGEQVHICTGPDWKTGDGPIRFDGLRNGETYDAREERHGWASPCYDDSEWSNAVVVPGPGGILQEQSTPPCKVTGTLTPDSVNEIRDGVAVYDLGQNIAGWAQLSLEGGESGREIVLRYGERLKDNGEIDQANIATFIKSGECQTDHYIMKGDENEIWEPRFTYHGFRYIQVEGLPEKPNLNNISGRVVRTAFDEIGSFECSSDDVNQLQQVTKWSYIGNFVGIPTDCPHREKNGWTGDAQLAAEAGLMNYSSAGSYRQWLESMADGQRPSGQLPAIVPTAGWGYNWGSGPAWDNAFILIPWYIYLYTGDVGAIKKHYEGIKRYVDFCTSMATDHILSFGLGDWCPADEDHAPPASLTSTAYYYVDARLLSKFAELTGNKEDIQTYNDLAAKIRESFNRHFYKGNGTYAGGEMTALGCALYQGLVKAPERKATAQKLAEAVEANECKVDFGILGSKYVPRSLADNGYVELAYRLITQPEFPGWVHWLRKGATTFRETWGDINSRNHVMFGDISAWFYHYLAGIKPDPENPGFKHFFLEPQFVEDLDWVNASYRTAFGTIKTAWYRQGESIKIELELPEGTTATFTSAEGTTQKFSNGSHTFITQNVIK